MADEVIPIPTEALPDVVHEFRLRLATGALPFKPANDQTPPSKYFSAKSLMEFNKVWETMKDERIREAPNRRGQGSPKLCRRRP